MNSPEVDIASEPSVMDSHTTIEGFLLDLPDRLDSDAVAGWTARFHLCLDDRSSAEWTVVVAGGSCTVRPGLIGRADCSVTSSSRVLSGIASGEINPQLAYLLGRIKVSDLDLLLRLIRALR